MFVPLLRIFFGFAAPATLNVIFEVIVWQRSEVFFLDHLSSTAEVGFYNLAFTIYAVFLGLGWTLINGFYPAISRDFGRDDWTNIRKKTREGVTLSVLFSAPLSFGGLITLDGLTTLLYGHKMHPSVIVGQVLFAGLVPGVVSGMYGLMVNAVGGIWLNVRLGAVLSVVNVGLDFLLIPHLGALGASVANTAAQTTYAILLMVAARRRFGITIDWSVVGGVVGLGLAATLLVPEAVQVLLQGVVGLIIAVLVGGLLYCTLAWRLGYVPALRRIQVSI
jgi:O-antigen/teichoic acid export membrane protein